MMRAGLYCVTFIALASLAACGPKPENKAEAPKVEEVAPATLATDAWLGDWIGVEGNTLKIEAGATPGNYKIAEGQLDGPITYDGRASGAEIAFTDKDGQARTIKAGAGKDTGLKYLDGKSNCLWIEAGRGFCRD
jgi:hypothetical protein